MVELDASCVEADEPMGSKNKMWVSVPGRGIWLFKEPRRYGERCSGEHWAEKVACELAGALELPHAAVELATFEGRAGVVSRRFSELEDKTVELVHGTDVLAGHVLDYNVNKRRQPSDHTLANIVEAVTKVVVSEPAQSAALHQLAGFVALDGLIVNTDRHHENWAVFRRTTLNQPLDYWIAPSFDHASSLGRELPESTLQRWNLEDWRIDWYIERAKGAVYLDAKHPHGANPLRLVEVARRLRPGMMSPWLERVARIEPGLIIDALDRVPSEIMPGLAKAFTRDMLRCTQQRIAALR